MQNLKKTADILFSGKIIYFETRKEREAIMIAMTKKYKLNTSDMMAGHIGGYSYYSVKGVFSLFLKKELTK